MSVFMQWRRCSRGLFVLAAGAALTLGGAAKAQFGEAAGIAEIMQPDFFKRDVTVMSQGLKFDDAQRVIVNALFDDYMTSHEESQVRMRQRFDEMRDQLQTGDQRRIMKTVFGPFRELAAEKAQLRAQFLANVEVVLTQEQLESWPAVQRRLYRERKLSRGRLSGESLNLFDIVRDMHLDERATQRVQPVLDQYDIALDRALHERDDPISGAENPMLDALAEQDPAKSQEVLQKRIELQAKVRNVNDTYIELIAQAMPEELGATFRASAMERGYPRVYRETPVQRLFIVARELEGLETEVREAIITLESEFLGALATINAQLLQAIRSYEPQEAHERASDFARRMAGQQVEPKTDPTRELFAKRDEISRDFAKRLYNLLTPEQFAQLPGGYRWVEVPVQTKPQQVQPINTKDPKTFGDKGDGAKQDDPTRDS